MRIYIKTFGCAANQADSEIIAGLLSAAGHDLTSWKNAQLIIINSCFVKGPTENKVLDMIQKARADGKKVLVCGCLPQAYFKLGDQKLLSKLQHVSVLGLFLIHKIAAAVAELEHGKRIVWLSDKKRPKLGLPKQRKNPVIEIVPIAEGCTGACTYCCTRIAKGRLCSYPKEIILEQIQRAIKRGAKEIWITSQDNGAWGLERGERLPDLLREICALEGDFMIRIGMMNPNNLAKIAYELVEIYKHPKIFKFLHLPVQSGSNKILKAMGREYTVEQFVQLVQLFRAQIQQISIATDVICGFPGETEEDFEQTLNLIKQIKPDVLNISRYWNRPGTRAAAFDNQLSQKEIMARSKKIWKEFGKLAAEKNASWLGWEGEILIDEKGFGQSWIGRNFAYKPIVVNGKLKLGQKVRIKVKESKSNYLIASFSS